jgi:cation:H+ antiporter
MPALAMFLLGLLLLVLGADSLMRGASGLGQRFGLTPFLAGLMLAGVVAAIPELAVFAQAAASGRLELAIGSAIGASLAGIAFALGAAAMVAPLAITMRVASAMLVFVLVAAGLLLALSLDGAIARGEGGLLLAGYVACLWLWFARGRAPLAPVQAEFTDIAETATGLSQNLIRLGFAAALLYFGSRNLVASAPVLGAALGLDGIGTGLVLLAVAAVLPKLVFLLMAARGQGNVAAGVVFGACLAELLLAIGAASLYGPVALSSPLAGLALLATMALALVLYPLLGGELRIDRRRGAVLLLGGAAWLGYALIAARS